MSKPILISGIQPSGKPHLGNYLGMLKNVVDLQNTGRYQCFAFIADLHSITEDYAPKEKFEQIKDTIMTALAAGVNPEKTVIFIQSQIPEHAELAWILNTITPFGELKRMTQFKDKSERQKENINAGLFNYPTLMAADILLYDAEYVPVGEDQLQHLELTRTLARKFNQKFSKEMVEPKALLTETPRIMSLHDPLKKMSKSAPEGCLFLDDSPEVIRQKIKRAVTDSGSEVKYEPDKKPAVTNLIRIYRSLSGLTIKQIEKKFSGKNYGAFKKDLAELVIDYFLPFRKKKQLLMKNPEKLLKVAEKGRKKAQALALQKMSRVKKSCGLAK